jgi:hypothetical protein
MDDDREEYRDPIPTPAELAAWVAAQLDGKMPREGSVQGIVTTGAGGAVVGVRIEGNDLGAPDGIWVRHYELLVRERP